MSQEVRALAARAGMKNADLSAACGIKVGRLGYLLREEKSWTLLEIDDVADVFEMSASELLTIAENAVPITVTPKSQDDYAPAADGEYADGEDEGTHDSA